MAHKKDDRGGRAAAVTCVQFVCQRCSNPIKLDRSVKEMTRSAFHDLAVPPRGRVAAAAAAAAVIEQDGAAPLTFPAPLEHLSVKGPPPLDETDPGLWGPEEMVNGRTSLHTATQVAARLFDVMSENAEIDHPLCEECTDTLLDQLDVQLREAEKESTDFKEFLNRYLGSADPAGSGDGSEEDGEGSSALQDELKTLEEEEAVLIRKLSAIEVERARIRTEVEGEKGESNELDVQEERYWKDYNEFQRVLADFYQEQASVENQMRRASAHHERLTKTNIFNDTFHIWRDGHFGTINNFRLGRLPSVPVHWNEINAAWGQTVLLLHTMAVWLGFKFKRYRLVPNGSHSRLERSDDNGTKELPLFGSGGFKLFSDKKFDDAMGGFLDCLCQLKDHIESKEPHFKLPYRIEKDKIGDSHTMVSVRIQFSQEESWTKALKFMLTNLKWCLAWVCKQMT